MEQQINRISPFLSPQSLCTQRLYYKAQEINAIVIMVLATCGVTTFTIIVNYACCMITYEVAPPINYKLTNQTCEVDSRRNSVRTVCINKKN